MKTSAEIREEVGRQVDRVQALLDLADARADKSNTVEERSEIDRIQGKGKKGEKDHQAGVIGQLEDDLARAEAFETRLEALAQKRTGKPGVQPQTGTGEPELDIADHPAQRLAKLKVPATARFRHAGMRAFLPKDRKGSELFGDRGDEAAYLTGMFILATIGRSPKAQQWCKDNGVDLRFYGAMQESDNTLGGFLVPIEMEKAIINLREERGVFRREARIVPMSTDTYLIPRRTAGLTAYFVNEGTAPTASNPTLDQVQLISKKLMTLTPISSEVSEDAVISIADWLASEIAYAFADKEDNCGFLGDGTSTYGHITGIANALAAGSTVTSATGHTAFSTLTLSDFHSMVATLPLYANQNAKWYISRAGFASSMQRLMAAGGGNTWATLADGNRPLEFLGYPVVLSQVLNNTLTAQTSAVGVCYFGDMAMTAALGNRRGLAIDASPHFYFSTDQLAVRGASRFDINIHEKGTSSVAGSMVMLNIAGS